MSDEVKLTEEEARRERRKRPNAGRALGLEGGAALKAKVAGTDYYSRIGARGAARMRELAEAGKKALAAQEEAGE